ncbi:MAG: homoserine kinase [Paraglaciecola sp.]|jgi:homoserine kinase
MNPGIKVFAPASVGNVGVGFDCLGFALEKPGDEVLAKFTDKPGLTIKRITGTRGKKLPLDVQKNTAGLSAYNFMQSLNEPKLGIEIEIHKKMPLGSGLGSSAASAVGGVMAINELLGQRVEKRELLKYALDGEELASTGRNADNVAPSLLGGMILIRDSETLDLHRLPHFNHLYATVICPKIEILTKNARNILSDTVPLSKMIQQSANLASLVVAMYKGDEQLLGRSLNDVVIEPQRSKLIPHFDAVKNGAMEMGALGGSISGAGPSIFMLSKNSLIAEDVGEAMKKIYHDAGIEYELFVSPINHEGAIKC